MNLEGRLVIKVRADETTIRDCLIESNRPVDACRILNGRRIGDALAMVPRLYTVCGHAQLAAARSAVEAAQGDELDVDAQVRRQLRVLGESAGEYAWRFLIDLPQLMGKAPQASLVARLRSYLAAATAEPVGNTGWGDFYHELEQVILQLLGEHPAEWLERTDFSTWCDEGSTATAQLLQSLRQMPEGQWSEVTCALLPALPAPDDIERLAESMATQPGFIAIPEWQGEPRESGALARQHLHPLLQGIPAEQGVVLRLAARLVEMAHVYEAMRRLLASYPTPPWMGAQNDGDGVGVAWVETARGLLLHRVTLDGEQVADYRVLAPTEWNFHPRGTLSQGLKGATVASRDELERRVRLAVLALDPCVAYDLEMDHA